MPIAGIQMSVANRVKETTGTTGTGAYQLNGASSGFQSFATIGDGAKTPYTAIFGAEWEVGVGTVSTGVTNSLSRDEILDSSNGGAAVNWSAGTKDIWNNIPAEWFNLVGPWGATFQPESNSTNVVVVKDAAGSDRIVLRVAADGSANISGRDSSGVERVRMLGGDGSVDADDLQIQGASIEPKIAKAWAKFSTNGTIVAGHNVSSITDNGSGDWTVNWSTPFANADYAVVPSILLAAFDVKMCAVRIQNSSAVRIISFTATTQGEANVTHVYVVAFGSQ